MSHLYALADWLVDAPESVVAVTQGKVLTKADLCQRVSYWRECFVLKEGQRWAAYHSDAFEFLAIVLALWQAGCTACVPGDNLPATFRRLQTHVDGFAGEFRHKSSATVIEGSACPSWRRLDTDFVALEIYTSGSTGEPKPIQKTLGNLDNELQALEALWPDHKDSVVISTATHQHLYGMTFRLFWPLCRGQVFETETCQYHEDIFQRFAKYSKCSLVSTPSHLGRLNPLLDWQSIADHCVVITSSAAPLKREDSLMLAGLLHVKIREVYGSSETGAIGWRIQTGVEDALWQLLPGVELQPASHDVFVSGSHISGQHKLADQLELGERGHFQLLGRMDRVVKVEGKRVSLAEVESATEQHDYIKLAKALVITRKRSEIALVAELTERGWAALNQLGARGVQREIRAVLQERFETVLLPRRWRFVAQMPYNTQGKLPLESLQAMFDPELIKWPVLASQAIGQNSAELSCQIPAELVYFDGHFPKSPILPGVVQVHWAEHYGRQFLDIPGVFHALEAVKFQQVIFPRAVISISLQYDPERQKLGFRFYSEKGVHSSGRICFR